MFRILSPSEKTEPTRELRRVALAAAGNVQDVVGRIPASRRRRWPAVCLIALVWCCSSCSDPRTPDRSLSPSASVETSLLQQISEVSAGRRTEILLSRPLQPDELTALLAVADRVRVLTISDHEYDNAQWHTFISKCQSLERLKADCVINDEDLGVLAKCASLNVLNLPNGTFSDHGLEQLAPLLRLELLRIHSANVSDAGIMGVAKLPALRFLHLIDVPITDAGLETIAQMENLESFYLDGGNCTDEGLSALIKQRFDLHFHWNDLHLDDDPKAHAH